MPNHCITTTSIAPMRKDPSHRSEMISQSLFGEMATVLETSGDWSRLKLDLDGQEGWVDNCMITIPDEETRDSLKDSRVLLIDKMAELNINTLPYPIKLVPGSEIHLNGLLGNQMVVDKHTTFSLKQRVSSPMHGNIRHSITSKALEFVNAPYLWGGRSLFGIDCSGLTQLVCKLNGITLPRDASQQLVAGRLIKTLDRTMMGDLAFFSNDEGRVCHVGIIHEQGKIIHAHGHVRIDSLDETGILDQQTGRYSHKLAFIRNVVD